MFKTVLVALTILFVLFMRSLSISVAVISSFLLVATLKYFLSGIFLFIISIIVALPVVFFVVVLEDYITRNIIWFVYYCVLDNIFRFNVENTETIESILSRERPTINTITKWLRVWW